MSDEKALAAAKAPQALRGQALLEALKVQPANRVATRESLLLLLDASGSMGGGTWEILVDAADALARASDPKVCRMAAAIFSNVADVIVSWTSDLHRIATRLEDVEPLGGTGMKEALTLAGTISWPALDQRRTILFSDGMPTTGDPLPAARALSEMGITIDTVGCGESDEETLRAIAAAGKGRYVYASSVAELVQVFRTLETRARYLLR